MVKTTTVSAMEAPPLPGGHSAILKTPRAGTPINVQSVDCAPGGAWLWIFRSSRSLQQFDDVAWGHDHPRLDVLWTTRWSDRLRSPNFRSLINENILEKCFRSSLSFRNPRISPLTRKYRSPRLFLLIITAVLETNKIEPHVLFYYSMLMYSSIGLL